jgi:uncharacterized phage infection (PIP) family protein YhgE
MSGTSGPSVGITQDEAEKEVLETTATETIQRRTMKMFRMLNAAILAGLLWVVQPAAAQAQPSADDVKKLEAEIEKLKSQIQEAEARLKKAMAGAAKKEEKQPAPPKGRGDKRDPEQLKKTLEKLRGVDGPLGKIDFEQMKKLMELAAKAQEQFGGNLDIEQLKKLRELAWNRGGKKAEAKEASSDIDKKLDRILKEIEELRKEIRKK